VLSLGPTPLANSLVDSDRREPKEVLYPLDVQFCRECSLMQIDAVVTPEHLFSEYVYRTSFSDTMVRHAAALADRLVAERGLGPRSLVVEAASNDGYLLRAYRDAGVPVLGIEPAANIAASAEAVGIPTRAGFFTLDSARALAREGVVADVFHAHNVLAHVPDLNGFVSGIRTILAPDGIAVIETPYVRDLLERREFDTIYHEHLSYFSVTALAHCLTRNGLTMVDVDRIPVHGGSLRVLVARGTQAPVGRVAELLEEETRWGVASMQTYARFAARVEELRDEIHGCLRRLRDQGRRVAAYGASAKGTTLLAYCGIGRDLVEFVVDRSPHKQGRFMPGARIPIHPTEQLIEEMPDYALLLAWNFADEILEQQAEYRGRGGRFIVPIPAVRVV
jgi:SAM-dependent methyltransferase